MSKLNCWEVKKCGREPNGSKVSELGVCPVVAEERLDGIHGGLNAGRSCWVVSGSLCGGKIQGMFAQKYENCYACDFYKLVKEEEGSGFKLAAVLLGIVKENK